MSWESEARIIERTVATMRAAGIPVTPGRMEQVVNGVNAAQQAVQARVDGLRRKLSAPEHYGLIAAVNLDTGEIGSVGLVPTFRLSDARRTELEQQAKALQLIVDDPRSTIPAQKKASYELAHIQRLLELDASTRPTDQRTPAEREATTTPGPRIP